MGNRPKVGPRISQLAAGVAVGLLLIGGCSADRQQRQTAPPSSTSTALSSTTTATVRTVGDCTRPAGKGVADSSVGPFSAVKMVTARRGWAVGQGIIVGTDDGVHWSQQYSGPEPFAGIDAVDSLHAWAVGTQHLFATSDGGRHWSEVGEPTEPEEPLQSVDFVDAHHGFGIAGFTAVVVDRGYSVSTRGGILVVTDDGGRTWTRRSAPCDAQSVCATDTDNAWLVAGNQLYRTHDGGGVWQPVLTLARYRTPGGYLHCPGPGTAWVLSMDSDGGLGHKGYVAYRTSDDGRTWRTVMVEHFTNVDDIPGPPGPGSYPGPFSALGPSDAVFVGVTPPVDEPTSTMLATSGGRTLRPERPVAVRGFLPGGASYLTAQQGWIVGSTLSVDDPDPGLIIATTDGGRTWQKQFPP